MGDQTKRVVTLAEAWRLLRLPKYDLNPRVVVYPNINLSRPEVLCFENLLAPVSAVSSLKNRPSYLDVPRSHRRLQSSAAPAFRRPSGAAPFARQSCDKPPADDECRS